MAFLDDGTGGLMTKAYERVNIPFVMLSYPVFRLNNKQQCSQQSLWEWLGITIFNLVNFSALSARLPDN